MPQSIHTRNSLTTCGYSEKVFVFLPRGEGESEMLEIATGLFLYSIIYPGTTLNHLSKHGLTALQNIRDLKRSNNGLVVKSALHEVGSSNGNK